MLEAPAAVASQAEAFAETRRFWFRSKDVALGVFGGGASAPDSIRYWKFHRDGKWRRRSFAEDRKLFEAAAPAESFQIHAPLLSYKPESRAAWRCARGEALCVAKLYSPTTFARAEAAARLWASAAEDFGARLELIDPSGRVIIHEFAGEPASAALLEKTEPPRGFHQIRMSATEPAAAARAPVMLPLDVCRHLRQRIEAHAQWLPLAAPDCTARFMEIRERARSAADEIFNVEPVSEPVLLHGDFRPKNLVASASGGLKWIDYDHVVWGDPEWDLAAWQADTGRTLEPEGEICPARLAAYAAAWRVLLDLEAIEERRAA